MKMYSYIISEEQLDIIEYNKYLWVPCLVCQPNQMVFKKQRNYIQIIKCIVNSTLIISWDFYYITYEIKPNYMNYGLSKFIINYSFRLGILIVVNHYLIFDYFFGFFKEITKVENVIFYEDWWNADGFGQLNRKWNKQVHNFLKINIYQRLSKKGNNTKALLMTYLVTALLHEYCINVTLKTLRLYFLFFSCFQFILIPYQKYIPFPRFVLFSQILFGNSLLIYLYTYY
ncbi:unnamed protein product (macronuclear) [Paramecium tetraurelia]|uniref:Diacylglycerol O-acyltransferase n=1 Tax=Paramecium tetraurelia TaxID=5888 RepID=A0BQV6_PARTE|nr:uncharacterized protein GSPATT00031152001 [Paramecium tetraurelia]CAK60923.1 unnamed protein product [Paramecium tetraurelia]|eukprot:XP_001428321.1 hypothetical protein (macronuclear) [Paramecium tetraurelia strain d4-2]